MDKAPELTIISVYHNEMTKRFVELNYDFMVKFNSFKNWIWLVGDNSPPSLIDKIDSKKFKIITNQDAPLINRDSCGKYWTSYQHASALNLCLKEVKTRFVLILDNDFYVIYPEWLREALNHMIKNNLAFLGAPYYPKDYRKIRYFPATDFCMFVDLEKVPLDTLDFTPDFGRTGDNRKTKKRKTNLFNLGIRKRNIGTSHDTGYFIYKRYYQNSLTPCECIKPVYNPWTDLRLAGKLGLLANALLEFFLPDRLCYIPKKRDYYVASGFSSFGHFDARRAGWEEHMWKGKPFAFHVRSGRNQKRGSNEEELITSIRDVL